MKNVRTKIYPESTGGIMICGINWGGDPNGVDDGNSGQYAFADKAHNSFPYSEALITWFEAWGVRLDRSSNPGKLERCLIQTNWCDSQSRDAKSISEQEWQNTPLFGLIKELKPRAIILTAVTLLPRFQKRASEAGLKLLKEREPHTLVSAHGKTFRMHVIEYDKTNVVALPHPSRFRSIIGKSISQWKNPARLALGRVIDPKTGTYM